MHAQGLGEPVTHVESWGMEGCIRREILVTHVESWGMGGCIRREIW